MIDIDPEIEVGFREALQEAFARGRAQSEPDRDLRRAVKSLAKQVRILKSADQPRDHAGRFAETSHAIASEHDRHMAKVQKMGDAEAAGEHATKATSGAFKRIKESAGKHWAHARDRIRGILPPGDAERLIELQGDGVIAEAMDDVGEALDARKAVAESEGTRPEREEAREEVTHRIDRLHRAIEDAVASTGNERAMWREGKSLAGRDEPDFTERLAFLRKAWEEVRLLKSVDASGHEHKGKGPGGGQFGKGGGGGGTVTVNPPKSKAKPVDKVVSKQPEDKYVALAKQAVKGKIKDTKQRAWTGEQTGAPIDNKLAGAIGEEVIIAHLKSLGYADADYTSSFIGTNDNNIAFDLIHDHQLVEAKTGQTGKPSGTWALKYDGAFTKDQEAKFARMKPDAVKEAKRKINLAKVQGIHDRKEAFAERISKELGDEVKPGMITVIINPDTKVADLYQFDGIHDRINWNGEQAQSGYLKSVKYG